MIILGMLLHVVAMSLLFYVFFNIHFYLGAFALSFYLLRVSQVIINAVKGVSK